jgi:hypothetical protein
MPDSTEAQQDKTKAGQRRINIMWEGTQGIIAIGITGAQIYCSIHKGDSREITYAFFLIVSMYFVRTNHHLTGGVGAKTPDEQR